MKAKRWRLIYPFFWCFILATFFSIKSSAQETPSSPPPMPPTMEVFDSQEEYVYLGIDFFNGSWEEAIAKAKEENKPIFLDAFTTWCMPCRRMEKNVFSKQEVGEYYNDLFINMRVDMEKGDGPALAAKYNIKTFPTYLYFDANGEAVHKTVGERDPFEFLFDADNAINEKKQFFILEQKFESKEGMTPEVLYNYATALESTGHFQHEHMTDISNTYLETQEDPLSKKNMSFIMKTVYELDSKAFEILLNNKETFQEEYGQDLIIRKFSTVARNHIAFAVALGDEKMFKETETLINDNLPVFAGWLNGQLAMQFYEGTNDWENYAKAADNYVDPYAMKDADILYQVAWNFYEHVEDEDLLKKAIAWTEHSMDINQNYYNTATYAHLLYKTDQMEEAMKVALAAQDMAAEMELNTREIGLLLHKLKMKQ